VSPPPWSLIFAVLPAAALVFGEFLQVPLLAPACFSISFLTGALYLCSVLRKTPSEKSCWQGSLLIAALVFSALGAWTDPGLPSSALILLWAIAGLPILAVAPQFLRTFMGGSYPSPRAAKALFFAGVTSVAAGAAWFFYPHTALWYLFAILVLLSLILFSLSARAGAALFRLHSAPLAPAFVSAFVWAFAGAGSLFGGPQNADVALHLWATGWATTLIIALSIHIAGFMSGLHLSRARTLLPVIALWQLVPIGRGLQPLFAFPASFSRVVAWAASLVLVAWAALLFRAVRRIVLRQMHLRGSECMVEER
jgi:hypothetical protein